MAAEVIALLHSLLMAPESNAAQIWTTTAEKVSKQRINYQIVMKCIFSNQEDLIISVFLSYSFPIYL